LGVSDGFQRLMWEKKSALPDGKRLERRWGDDIPLRSIHCTATGGRIKRNWGVNLRAEKKGKGVRDYGGFCFAGCAGEANRISETHREDGPPASADRATQRRLSNKGSISSRDFRGTDGHRDGVHSLAEEESWKRKPRLRIQTHHQPFCQGPTTMGNAKFRGRSRGLEGLRPRVCKTGGQGSSNVRTQGGQKNSTTVEARTCLPRSVGLTPNQREG